MKTIKIIDLLNKIANGEEVPKEIVYNTRIFRYNEYNKCYIWHCNRDEFYLSTYYRIEQILNDEVEIIEEDKKITKIEKLNNVGNSKDIGEFKDKQQLNNHILKNKINELIDVINNLKGSDD